MIRGYNSTIIRKKKVCKICGKEAYIFSKNRCQPCATLEDTQKRMETENERAIDEEGLSVLIDELDDVFSKWLRLSAAGKDGYLNCFICGKRVHWKEAQNNHYIKRGTSLFLRHDPRNCKAGCKECNEYKGGNYIEYAKKLELQSPGITDILYEESTIPYHATRTELKQLISDYSNKVTVLLKTLNL